MKHFNFSVSKKCVKKSEDFREHLVFIKRNLAGQTYKVGTIKSYDVRCLERGLTEGPLET